MIAFEIACRLELWVFVSILAFLMPAREAGPYSYPSLLYALQKNCYKIVPSS